MLKQRQWRRRSWRCADEGLEDTDMEHIMDASIVRQLPVIRHLTNALHHLKGASILGPKLPSRSRLQRLRRAVEQAQENPVSYCKLQETVMGIIMLASVLLRLE